VRAVPEKPAKVLLDEAADADLLVVGTGASAASRAPATRDETVVSPCG